MGKRARAEKEEPSKKQKKDEKEKKEKKDKKEKKEAKAEKVEKTEEPAAAAEGEDVVRICVPIAHPFSNDVENLTKKILAMVKYATKEKTMVRGIKEVTKIVRKGKAAEGCLVVLAADISPLDVISHMPLLLESKEVQYVWVPSRSDLGAATLSKRPTSAVIIKKVPSDKEESYNKVRKIIAKMHKSK
eukprot:TRINITY_DN6328_c0_g2_i1.p1 TRINITY_DN6328_c0_g2~~TRINITY_DN6328_c0_g2_i1.p1  ORF type:complete len:188 (+),score=68.61 TRINITY_DN6328_c0_g2_i1:43-606(+)